MKNRNFVKTEMVEERARRLKGFVLRCNEPGCDAVSTTTRFKGGYCLHHWEQAEQRNAKADEERAAATVGSPYSFGDFS